MSDFMPTVSTDRLSANRLAITGALVTAMLFLFCWALGALGFVGSHAFVSLFTLAPVLSITALCIGGFSAAVFGGIGGAAIALIYNALGARFV